MLKTITVGPFAGFFTNVNREMAIPGHSHFCKVTLTYRTLGSTGFPAFAATYAEIQAEIKNLFDKPLRDYTNERVADLLWLFFEHWQCPTAETTWKAVLGEAYELHAIELAVRGVPDRIGHADGYTLYRIEAK